MDIILHPQRRDAPLTLSKSGDALTINGEVFDFGALPNGASLPADAIASDLFVGPVSRDETGKLTIGLVLPHGPLAPQATRFPDALTDVPDGDVTLPEYGAAPVDVGEPPADADQINEEGAGA